MQWTYLLSICAGRSFLVFLHSTKCKKVNVKTDFASLPKIGSCHLPTVLPQTHQAACLAPFTKMFGHSFTFGWSALALCFASGSASAALVTHQPCSPKPQQFLESTQLGRHVGDFEYPWNGTFFSGVFTDGAVLQQSPAAAAVYGIVAGPTSADTKVSVQVTDQTTRESYAVVATAKQLLPVKKSTRSGVLCVVRCIGSK